MNVLAIGAHFDDIEIGCSGALIKHALQGDKVFLLVVTHSGYTNYDGTPVRESVVALDEGKRAAQIIGAELIALGMDTKKVQYGHELIESINKIIDDKKIDMVYTHWSKDVHQDHAVIGRATLNAARHVPRILMYKSNWYSTDDHFMGNFFVDISDVIEKKKQAIMSHESELKKFGPRWLEFVIHQNRNNGFEMELEFAEVFHVIKYLRE